MPSPASKLLAWYRKHGRILPWRNTQDPYRILVSELMLQQTQVPRVLMFYPRWLKQFPDWSTLAKASNADVISAWAGLGYNRRALMLRDIAKQVIAYGVPKSEEEWRLLKGIGPYTAAALAAFSLRARTLPIDTNIRRVLGRVLLGKPFPDLADDEKIQKKANAFLPIRGDFHDVPQALFDLATLVCTKTPACEKCPLRNDCPAAKKFLSGKITVPKRTTKKTRGTHSHGQNISRPHLSWTYSESCAREYYCKRLAHAWGRNRSYIQHRERRRLAGSDDWTTSG